MLLFPDKVKDSLFGSGVFTLLTISLGEELESKFFKILSCVSLLSPWSCEKDLTRMETLTLCVKVLTGACIIMWLVVATGTVKGSISGKMFFAPCLGTDLFLRLRRIKAHGLDERPAERAKV